MFASCVPHLRGLRLYKLDLRVSIEPAQRAGRVGESVQCAFVVTNVGALTLEGCLETADREVSLLRAGKRVGGWWSDIDHPGCVEPFLVGPGQVFRWVTSIDIPATAVGAEQITGAITVVDPVACAPWGCRSLRIAAEPTPFLVTAAEPVGGGP